MISLTIAEYGYWKSHRKKQHHTFAWNLLSYLFYVPKRWVCRVWRWQQINSIKKLTKKKTIRDFLCFYAIRFGNSIEFKLKQHIRTLSRIDVTIFVAWTECNRINICWLSWRKYSKRAKKQHTMKKDIRHCTNIPTQWTQQSDLKTDETHKYIDWPIIGVWGIHMWRTIFFFVRYARRNANTEFYNSCFLWVVYASSHQIQIYQEIENFNWIDFFQSLALPLLSMDRDNFVSHKGLFVLLLLSISLAFIWNLTVANRNNQSHLN